MGQPTTNTEKEKQEIYRALARHHAGIAEAYKRLHHLMTEEPAHTQQHTTIT